MKYIYSEEYQLALDLVGGDVEWMEQHGLVQPDELVAENHDDEFYCGICGWSHISTFPHSH